MGMAASQARYLALVARQTNCEYEGQQINQARTALSNQSANLFNQMLGLSVPVPPNTQDFTKIQYSYTDGLNASTIDSWQQLATPEEDYNYVVTSHYYTDVYTGSEKKLSDPQVQLNNDTATKEEIEAARKKVADAEDQYEILSKAVTDAKKEYEEAKKAYSSLSSYATENNFTTLPTHNDTDKTFTIESQEYQSYEKLSEGDKATATEMINTLKDAGVIKSSDVNNLYFNNDVSSFVIYDEIAALITAGEESGKFNTYNANEAEGLKAAIDTAQKAVSEAELALTGAEFTVNTAKEEYEALVHPTYIGNCELVPLATLDENQEAEIRQIVEDMEKNGITSKIVDYYNRNSGDYTGGIYSFKMNGVTYYTTYDDLLNSYNSGTGINNIDGQTKLPYYNATFVSTKIEKTEKALLETDGSGRFSSIRFESDSIKYTLKMETITDDNAYEDAMNQYYYESAKYDKMVQDINAKTSIIQQQDQQLELKLKQLDTERNALTNEIEAVQKIVKDNVEKSFKTFS